MAFITLFPCFSKVTKHNQTIPPQGDPALLLRAARAKLRDELQSDFTIAETDNPNYSVRILRKPEGRFQCILEPHAKIHLIHANQRPRLTRRFD